MAPKNSHGVTLRDGHWYSIVVKYPRGHQHAKWDAEQQTFIWAGGEQLSIPVDRGVSGDLRFGVLIAV